MKTFEKDDIWKRIAAAKNVAEEEQKKNKSPLNDNPAHHEWLEDRKESLAFMKRVKEQQEADDMRRGYPASGLRPHQIAEAAYKGLLQAEKRDNFRVDMKTYGYRRSGLFLGCLACCTVQYITGKEFIDDKINGDWTRAEFLNWNKRNLESFELAVNSFRMGYVTRLMEFCSVNEPDDVYIDLGIPPDYYKNGGLFKEWLRNAAKILKDRGY